MTKKEHSEITHMDWDDFEGSLQAATRGTKGGAAAEKTMREYFGDEEYECLQKLADHARVVRSRGPAMGNVVFLHGIMGSDLIAVAKDGDEYTVWVNFLGLIAGQIKLLKLSPDGSREDNREYMIKPGALDKRTYARAILWLKAWWNVQPFAYDWRKDIDVASNALASFIREKFGDQPVNLVAHSMGGLVSRNFIRLHRELWDRMRGNNGSRGGRLVMLGTPNYGSLVIPQTLTGVEKMVRLLATADLKNSLSGILDIIDTFVGSYQMLPSPAKIPPSSQLIYRKESWGDFPVSEEHLNRAFQFHTDLEKGNTIDPERMAYIAGCNRETLSGINYVSPGEFDYTITHDGDGRVPHALGLLQDVPVYYVDESHGDLPKNEKVLSAVHEILEHGRTTVLSDKPIISRAVSVEGAHWRRPADEELIKNELKDIASRAEAKASTPEDLRIAEEIIMRSVLGQDKPVSRKTKERKKKEPPLPKKPLSLHIEVVNGDITQVKAPVVVIGHYKGIAPVSAEGAIDNAIDFWISRAGQRGIIGADLGELFFIPITRKQIAARAVLLAGMGEEGKFALDDLRYLMTNVAYSVSALGEDTFASVIIGSGKGNLSKRQAIRGILEGLRDALHRLPKKAGIVQVKKLILVEYSEEYYKSILDILNGFRSDKKVSDMELKITPMGKRGRSIKWKDRPEDIPEKALPGTRITIERNRDTFVFSALQESAVIPAREVEVQSFFASGASERLMQSRTLKEQEQYGQLLNTYLIPEDFHQLIADSDALTLILDRSTASFPWEMACFRSAMGLRFFGPDLKLTRQFRTMLSSTPGVSPQLNRQLKVLVIADPCSEPELQLPGARREGREVVKILNQYRKELDITVVDRIGAVECDPVEILALILNEDFDIVHFAGHGVFDEKDPHHSGWVFGRGRILSAREIFRARRVPMLVFSNACFSAVIRERQAMTADEMNRRLAGLAEAFFERGIQNYIGSGWPVDDEPAVEFASVFYENALRGEILGESLSLARKKIIGQGSTWGAYQHYGQVNARLVTKV